MRLFRAENWLKSPLDRDVIARWTVGRGLGMSYALDLPVPADPERFTFLALGDTGDSEAVGPHVSPQDAVAREMARDAALPANPGKVDPGKIESGRFDSGKVESGKAALVVHTGDVVYMTGERRLYDRNFRQPYAEFLTPQSTVDSLTFRLPFLPVPGNHDYYDLAGWTRWLARMPLLGAGVRAISHELFAFSLPEGGSDMGHAYMSAFVDSAADTGGFPLPYRPGERTRLPNRYYKFTLGNVDFFALDSNTLEAPPPWSDGGRVRSEADQQLKTLAARARELDRELRRQQLALEEWRETAQREASADSAQQTAILEGGKRVEHVLGELVTALQQAPQAISPCQAANHAATMALRRWMEATADLNAATEANALFAAVRGMDEASDAVCAMLSEVEGCPGNLPEGPQRAQLLAARDAVQRTLHEWAEQVASLPVERSDRIHQLSEEALDVQRELALERRRLRYRTEDYDEAQRQWLEGSLIESTQLRPDNWRVVYLHHPLYTTISNHCERPDVQGLRANLLPLLQGRVHLILSGHSHAFEWFRSEALPHTGLFVTGGGGQLALRPTMLEPQRLPRHRHRYQALRANGVRECAIGGRGPTAPDGETGLLYHYLRIDVSPEVLRVRPIGVRRLSEGYRREEPMPVYHIPELPEGQPVLNVRHLEAVEIRRDASPVLRWK